MDSTIFHISLLYLIKIWHHTGQIRTKNQSHQYQSFNQSEIPLDEETHGLPLRAKDYSLTE